MKIKAKKNVNVLKRYFAFTWVYQDVNGDELIIKDQDSVFFEEGVEVEFVDSKTQERSPADGEFILPCGTVIECSEGVVKKVTFADTEFAMAYKMAKMNRIKPKYMVYKKNHFVAFATGRIFVNGKAKSGIKNISSDHALKLDKGTIVGLVRNPTKRFI